MKKCLFNYFINFPFLAKNTKYERSTVRLTEIEDRMAIKNLVDTFSVLADVKETEKQTSLFTEDALVETFIGGKLVTSLKAANKSEKLLQRI